MAYNLKHTSTDQGSSNNSQIMDKNNWKLIYNANVPSTVIIFEWRLALDNLATKKEKSASYDHFRAAEFGLDTFLESLALA